MKLLSKNYEIDREIGRGGMGIVYIAKDKRLDRDVAIKVLLLDPNMEKEDLDRVIKRFYKEGKSLARLSHPNIVGIYDIGEEDNQYYMIMELLEGKSLAKLLQIKSHFTTDLTLKIGSQICNALAYIHDKEILHRDIKPGNIMFSDNNIAKLTDFGLAKINDPKSLTQTGSLFGSLMYIPPEQALGSKKLDNRADIYSLGITLYEILTGVSPFHDDTIAGTVRKVIESSPLPPSKLNKLIPKKLDDIILKSIRKDPEKRYQNAHDMEEDINRLIAERKTGLEGESKKIAQSNNTGFTGESEDNVMISSIIQFLSITSSTGRLKFSLNDKIEACLYIYEGNLTHAELGKLMGIDAISHMFCWKFSRGNFTFEKDYRGEKLFYKSLGKESIKDILDKVDERLESCKFKEFLNGKLKTVNTRLSSIPEDINQSDLDGNKANQKLYSLIKTGSVDCGTLMADSHNSEIESCEALFNFIHKGYISPFPNMDKLIPYSHLLYVINIISKFTDKSVALKFVTAQKSKLKLSGTENVSVRQLYRLSNSAFRDFTRLLPEKENRWSEMRNKLMEHLEKIILESTN